MIFRWPFVTVTVVTVLFLRVSILDNIYITIYISDIYKDFKRGYTPHFLTVTTVTVTLRPFFYFFTFLLFYFSSTRPSSAHISSLLTPRTKRTGLKSPSIFTGRKFRRSVPLSCRVIVMYLPRNTCGLRFEVQGSVSTNV